MAVLRVREIIVDASVAGDAPATPSATRDLPDLARFLFFALGADVERDVKSLDSISFDLDLGETLALVGEDGGGKSTIARTLARLVRPKRGTVELFGKNIHAARGKAGLEVRRQLQVVLDDEEAGIDPRLTVAHTLTLARRALRVSDDDAIAQSLSAVQLDARVLPLRAAELSAGDKKRVALARALLAEPSVLVIDEPASGLDPSERALLLEILAGLRSPKRALLLLCADLAAARTLAQRIGVLRHGALVEMASADALFTAPAHPYSQQLVAAAPRVRR